MLFHVRIDVRIPPDTDPDLVADLREAEFALAKQLQQMGKWRHLWRVAGAWSNISVFDVADADELHALLASLPLFPYLVLEVTALSTHPAAL